MKTSVLSSQLEASASVCLHPTSSQSHTERRGGTLASVCLTVRALPCHTCAESNWHGRSSSDTVRDGCLPARLVPATRIPVGLGLSGLLKRDHGLLSKESSPTLEIDISHKKAPIFRATVGLWWTDSNSRSRS